MTNNRKRLDRAVRDNKDVYLKESVTMLPACVECDSFLYGHVPNVNRVGVYRKCKCKGKVWKQSLKSPYEWEVMK